MRRRYFSTYAIVRSTHHDYGWTKPFACELIAHGYMSHTHEALARMLSRNPATNRSRMGAIVTGLGWCVNADDGGGCASEYCTFPRPAGEGTAGDASLPNRDAHPWVVGVRWRFAWVGMAVGRQPGLPLKPSQRMCVRVKLCVRPMEAHLVLAVVP